ncbi:BP74-related protein [Streptosporangium sandarakinum]|uniref:BP74 N-terminal domain-containing protein n=1 Tax=Streptosporangium sandarakinum TaxID=1260955 RepID=A0A852UQH8_9ACTN|nr:calmodulin-binding protein [Streptosporangium sandarakinum]NYF37888.1 hypothetical protein [Streptosporangium sandarakinum]
MRRTITTRIGILAAVAMLALAQPAAAKQADDVSPRAADGDAYFEFDYPPAPDKFIFKLSDPAKIKQARDILSGAERDRTHVMGRIVKRPAPYNPGWDFTLDPASTSFFEVAIEVCDASIRYVEDHLDEAGGAFLPGGHWCPWGSRLLREVHAPTG